MGTPQRDPLEGHEVAAARRAESGTNPGGGDAGSGPTPPAGAASPEIVRHLHEGMEVRGADTNRIGFVKAVREHDFLVNRQMSRDIYVPFDCIEAVFEDRLLLTLTQAEVNQRDWPAPPILG